MLLLRGLVCKPTVDFGHFKLKTRDLLLFLFFQKEHNKCNEDILTETAQQGRLCRDPLPLVPAAATMNKSCRPFMEEFKDPVGRPSWQKPGLWPRGPAWSHEKSIFPAKIQWQEERDSLPQGCTNGVLSPKWGKGLYTSVPPNDSGLLWTLYYWLYLKEQIICILILFKNTKLNILCSF